MSQVEVNVSRIATLMAVAALGVETTNVIDRMAFASSPEQAVRALLDAQRTVATLMIQGKVCAKVVQDYSVTYVGDCDSPSYKVYGLLPNDGEVEQFVEALYKDVRVARKVGAVALEIYLKVKEASKMPSTQKRGE
jgi:CRISPR type I-A-associated protein Csa5